MGGGLRAGEPAYTHMKSKYIRKCMSSCEAVKGFLILREGYTDINGKDWLSSSTHKWDGDGFVLCRFGINNDGDGSNIPPHIMYGDSSLGKYRKKFSIAEMLNGGANLNAIKVAISR
jgi:hypothetical protein